jgi:hypothetical protein
MLFLSDLNKPHIVDSLNQPMVVKHHWVFSAHMLDFKLANISYLEESTGPAIRLKINDFSFLVPATWNILVIDDDTYQVDTIPVTSCSNAKYHAFVMCPTDSKMRILEVSVDDFEPKASLVHPQIQRATGICHPIGTVQERGKAVDACVVIGPFDLHKWLNGKSVGDIL